ncbi:MAG: hypothetical protein DMG73_06265 [Acidobacteria bacterium]|nr:MAG: hypothetical protein DMG73_06265 [Acidobacteriota bacterium]
MRAASTLGSGTQFLFDAGKAGSPANTGYWMQMKVPGIICDFHKTSTLAALTAGEATSSILFRYESTEEIRFLSSGCRKIKLWNVCLA